MKLFLVGMSGVGSLDDLKEMMGPIESVFDGIVWVLHDGQDSQESVYLDLINGAGATIQIPFSRRHAFSRNHYLWCGPIQDGDWCVQMDALERLAAPFAPAIRGLIDNMERQSINAAFYFNKPFLFQCHESLEYVGSPHEGLRRHDGQMRAIELSATFPTERDVRYSVRAERRDDPFHWVGHYAKYYIEYPWGSNHCLLGNVNRGDEMTIYRARETTRIAFRDELRRRGLTPSVEVVVAYWRATPLDDQMRAFVNGEKILNDLYRYEVKGDKTVLDEHEWTSLKTILS